MIYDVWLTSSVEAILDSLPKSERNQFDSIVDFLSATPYPSSRHALTWRSIRGGRFFYSFYNGSFPLIVRYEIDEYPAARIGVVRIFALDGFALPGDPVTP